MAGVSQGGNGRVPYHRPFRRLLSRRHHGNAGSDAAFHAIHRIRHPHGGCRPADGGASSRCSHAGCARVAGWARRQPLPAVDHRPVLPGRGHGRLRCRHHGLRGAGAEGRLALEQRRPCTRAERCAGRPYPRRHGGRPAGRSLRQASRPVRRRDDVRPLHAAGGHGHGPVAFHCLPFHCRTGHGRHHAHGGHAGHRICAPCPALAAGHHRLCRLHRRCSGRRLPGRLAGAALGLAECLRLRRRGAHGAVAAHGGADARIAHLPRASPGQSGAHPPDRRALCPGQHLGRHRLRAAGADPGGRPRAPRADRVQPPLPCRQPHAVEHLFPPPVPGLPAGQLAAHHAEGRRHGSAAGRHRQRHVPAGRTAGLHPAGLADGPP